MTFTKHGYHIQGTFLTRPMPTRVARCGGPGVCKECSLQASAAPKKVCPDHNAVQHRDARPPWCDTCGLTADHQISFGQLDTKQEEYVDSTAEKTPEGFQEKAIRLVVKHANKRRDKGPGEIVLDESMVYVVWFAKTLQNWKALVSTELPDDMYYEVTYNGDKKETYVDSYKKWENSVYPDEEKVTAE